MDDVRRRPRPDTGNRKKLGFELGGFRADVDGHAPLGHPDCEGDQCAPSAGRHRESLGRPLSELCQGGRSRKCVGQPGIGIRKGSSGECSEPSRNRPRPGDRHLLPDHCSRRELESVGGSRHPDARKTPHQLSQVWVVRESLVDGDRIRVEIAEVTAPRNWRGRQVAQILEREGGSHESVVECESYSPRAIRQAETPPVDN